MASVSAALSSGALERILRGSSEIVRPVVQVVETKKIRDGRCRAPLWDGVQRYDYCMISKQAWETIAQRLEPRCLVKIGSFSLQEVNDIVLITVTECEVIASASEVGGDLLRSNGASKRGTTSEMLSSTTTPSKRPRPSQQGSLSIIEHVRLISSLEPGQNRCFIRARVSSKGEIIPWRNRTNEGKLFSFEVFDRSGEISITAFNLQCTSYYPMIERGKVYLISGFQCNPVNERWRTNSHPYALTLGMFSSVELCTEPCYDIPELTYNFVPISEIETISADRTVDICAILKSVSEPMRLNRRSDGKPLSKRDAYIVDDSKKMAKLTVWQGAVDKLNRTDNPVLLIQNAQVTEYNGTRSVSTRCSIEMNPDLGKARTLEAWWASGGSEEHFELVGASDGAPDTNPEYVDFRIMAELGENAAMFPEKALATWNRATITWLNRENSAYKACSQGCSKKVLEQEDGFFVCEKCSTRSRNFEWRFMLDMILSDATGELRCRAFNQAAERILGVGAKTFGDYIENDIDRMDEVLSAATFRAFHFKFRGKESTFRSENRIQFTVDEVVEAAPAEDCHRLLDDISLLEEFL